MLASFSLFSNKWASFTHIRIHSDCFWLFFFFNLLNGNLCMVCTIRLVNLCVNVARIYFCLFSAIFGVSCVCVWNMQTKGIENTTKTLRVFILCSGVALDLVLPFHFSIAGRVLILCWLSRFFVGFIFHIRLCVADCSFVFIVFNFCHTMCDCMCLLGIWPVWGANVWRISPVSHSNLKRRNSNMTEGEAKCKTKRQRYAHLPLVSMRSARSFNACVSADIILYRSRMLCLNMSLFILSFIIILFHNCLKSRMANAMALCTAKNHQLNC